MFLSFSSDIIGRFSMSRSRISTFKTSYWRWPTSFLLLFFLLLRTCNWRKGNRSHALPRCRSSLFSSSNYLNERSRANEDSIDVSVDCRRKRTRSKISNERLNRAGGWVTRWNHRDKSRSMRGLIRKYQVRELGADPLDKIHLEPWMSNRTSDQLSQRCSPHSWLFFSAVFSTVCHSSLTSSHKNSARREKEFFVIALHFSPYFLHRAHCKSSAEFCLCVCIRCWLSKRTSEKQKRESEREREREKEKTHRTEKKENSLQIARSLNFLS